MRQIARALAGMGPRLEAWPRLQRLLRRAEIAAGGRRGDPMVRALEQAWLLADRAGIPECHVGTAGRPS